MPQPHSESIDRLFRAVMDLHDEKECYDFFSDICTVKELQDIAQRLDAAMMLESGENYQNITKEIGISTATISRVSRCLNYGSGGYRRAIERLRMKGEDCRELSSVLAGLEALFSAYGYKRYKMSKFEEYDLYARNKDFLLSDQIITFNDTNGRLLALKPDVTLSIIKNTERQPGVQKLYYNENVYRVSGSSGAFGEIMQAGLECIGSLGVYELAEVVLLAGKALKSISNDSMLDISHIGLLSAVLDGVTADKEERRAILRCLYEKNRHELRSLCAQKFPDAAELLDRLVLCSGTPEAVLPELDALLSSSPARAAVEELQKVCSILRDSEIADMLRIDFSVSGDSKYYNGIVFKGYIRGIPNSVLTGGQYDNLLRRFRRDDSAAGFAVYLDRLERLYAAPAPYDVDVLIVYGADDQIPAAAALRDKLVAQGQRVRVQREDNGRLRYRTRYLCDGNEVIRK